MKSFSKCVAILLSVAMLSASVTGCKKNKTAIDAVKEQADSVGAETIEYDDLEDLEDDYDVDDLEDGFYMELTPEDIEDIDLPREASMFIDTDDIALARVYLRGEIDEDDLAGSGVGIVAAVKFNEEDDAVDFFENLYNYRTMLEMIGLDPDDLSDDEIFFDEDEAEGGLIINLDVGDLLREMASDLNTNFDSVRDDFDVDEVGRVVIALILHDDTVIVSLAYGDEFIEETDSIYTVAGLTAPSEVESSDVVVDFIRDAIETYLFGYITRGFDYADFIEG